MKRTNGIRIIHSVKLRITIITAVFLFTFGEAFSFQQQTNPQEQTEEGKPEASASKKSENSDVKRAKLGGSGFNLGPGGAQIHTGKASHKSDVDSSKPHKSWEFAGAPIPVVNPTVGNGLAGAGAILVHLDQNDHVSPPSVFGGGAVFTSNGTWAWGALTELFLKEDRYRILVVGGSGKVNYDYYGKGHASGAEGLFVPLTMDAKFFLVEPKMRLFGHWYFGPRYHLLDSSAGLNRDELKEQLPNLPDIDLPEADLKVKSAALGLRIERDSRNSQFYPTKGSLFDTKIDFFDSAFGSKRDYQNVEISFQGFIGFKEKNVIAYRGAVCSASERTPFYDLCLFGQSADVRGYSVGRYQDHRMLVGQVEYRRELFWRLGGVAYFGAGQVAESFSSFKADNTLPGGGIGMRFILAKESHINFRVDYAWGKDSSALYIGIAEAF